MNLNDGGLMDNQLQTPYFIIDEPILQRYYDMLTDSLK